MQLMRNLLVASCFLVAPFVQAADIETTQVDLVIRPVLSAQYKGMSAHYVETPQDIETVKNLCASTRPDGLPDNVETWAKNLITRLRGGNPYSSILIQEQEDPVAAIGFGRMPVLNYDPKHIDIIDTYLDFGVIRQKDVTQGYEKENFERVENFGLGFILPILPVELPVEKKDDIVKMATDIFQHFKDQGHLLPIEQTLPHDVITLLHPDDPVVESFQRVGFNLLTKEGFFGFYDKPRVMLHKVL